MFDNLYWASAWYMFFIVMGGLIFRHHRYMGYVVLFLGASVCIGGFVSILLNFGIVSQKWSSSWTIVMAAVYLFGAVILGYRLVRLMSGPNPRDSIR